MDDNNQNKTPESLEETKQRYKQEIDNIAKAAFNEEQKALARYILDTANEHNIESIYKFITQRVKLGFVFDAAPEVHHNSVSLLKHNQQLSFGTLGTKHKMIIGENYDALKNLLICYKNKVDVIYIDPPYNTEAAKGDGNDYKTAVEASKFVYRDKFTRNGWLNMMSERLKLAKQLLSDSGVIFISIDDNEQAYLKVLMDEIFGEENFVANLVWKSKSGGGNDSRFLVNDHEYIIMYCKNINFCKIYNDPLAEVSTSYNLEDENGKYALDRLDKQSIRYSKSLDYEIIAPDGSVCKPQHKDVTKPNATWRWSKETVKERYNELVFKDGKVYTKNYKKDEYMPRTLLVDERFGRTRTGKTDFTDIFEISSFDNPKPVSLIKHLLKISAKPESIILDFFAGSGTTGQAVMELNEEDGGSRQCILVSNNENNIAKEVMYERIYRVCNGVGTKEGETFKWQYNPNKNVKKPSKGKKSGESFLEDEESEDAAKNTTTNGKYLTNNSWDVFEIQTQHLKIESFEEAEKLMEEAKIQFKILNSDYQHNDFNIYYQLASLNPVNK